MGTWFWMAPEIIEQLKAGVSSSEVQFTHASDVYSYDMTCYEIVTGCIPYKGLKVMDTISQILQGLRSKLPHDLPEFVRNIIISCWHSNPLERPNFSIINMALQEKRSPNPMAVVVDNKSESGASIVKVEKWNCCKALTLLEVMQILMDMDLSILKVVDSSSIAMIMQYFEVLDCKGRKVVKDKSIANIKKALSLPVMHQSEWIIGSSMMFFTENTLPQMHVVEVIASWNVGLLGVLSRFFVTTNFRVHSSKCWTRKGQLECVIYVEGARMFSLLWLLRYNMEYSQTRAGHFKMTVSKVAAEEFSHLDRRPQNLKFINLTRPCNSSNIRVYLSTGSEESVQSSKVILCLENQRLLVRVSRYMELRDYKIVRASIEYLSEFPKYKDHTGKNTQYIDVSQDIDITTLVTNESEKISRIERAAIEHKCREWGDAQIIVFGYGSVVEYDLMISLRESGLVVTGGQVHLEFGTRLSTTSEDLLYFFTEKPIA